MLWNIFKIKKNFKSLDRKLRNDKLDVWSKKGVFDMLFNVHHYSIIYTIHNSKHCMKSNGQSIVEQVKSESLYNKILYVFLELKY